MFRSRIARCASLSLTIAALGASTAAARPADLRTPDAVDAGQPAVVRTTPGDVRTPDAVDAGRPATTNAGVDARTPDARDHGEGRGTFSAPDVTVIKVTDPSPSGAGFDWTDAGIGASGLLGLILLGLGGTAAVARRKATSATT